MRKGEKMKNIFLLSVFVCLLNSAFASEGLKDTAITIYNTESSSYVVLRQAPQKINLYICYTKYKGSLNNSSAAEAYFRNGLVQPGIKSCQFVADGGGNKNVIKNENGNTRYIYSYTSIINLSQFPESLPGFITTASTLTVDANDDLGKGPGSENILSLDTYITHENLKNPTISSERKTYNLSGYAKIEFPNLKEEP